MIESRNEPSDLRIKIVLVGDASTGKTNIKNRFCRGTFRQFSIATVGVQLASRNFWGTFQDKQSIFQMVLWDIGAKLYDETILPTYFRNALGVVYVYDVTRKQTFQKLETWRQLTLKHMNTQNFVQIIIGNKCDLLHFRQVNSEEVQKWALNKRIKLFYQTSALQNLYIQDAMQNLAHDIVSKFDDTIRRPIRIARKQIHHRQCI